MTTTITTAGKTLLFPDAARTPPTTRDLQAIADQVHPNALLVFATRLVRSVRRHRHQEKAAATNRYRLELARLCLDRALNDGDVVRLRPAAAAGRA